MSLSVPDLTCRFVHANQRDSHQNNWSLWVPALICVFYMQNSVFCGRITNLCESQTSPVILCLQNSVISIRIASLYGSQPLSVVFACKTVTFRSELQASIAPRPHLWFCACKTAPLGLELQVSVGPSGFCMQNNDFWTKITSLYVSQT